MTENDNTDASSRPGLAPHPNAVRYPQLYELFAIRPRAALAEAVPADQWQQGRRLQVWGVCTSLPPDPVHVRAWQVKVMFLAQCRRLDPAIRALLGDPPIAPEVFDRWWTIEHLGEVVDSVDVCERHMTTADLGLFAKTGDPDVDLWLDNLMKTCRRREAIR